MNQQQIFQTTGTSGGYRSRYREFLAQRNSEIVIEEPVETGRFSQGLINFGIFIALFIGILTLLGLGISRLNLGEKMQQSRSYAVGGASPQQPPSNSSPSTKGSSPSLTAAKGSASPTQPSAVESKKRSSR